MSNKIPENISLLKQGEEFLCSKAVTAIEQSDSLHGHIVMIECSMSLLDYFVRQHKHQNEDDLAIQCLGIRLFNASASAIKLMFSGYYQTSAATMRDVLETVFLLDYFFSNQKMIGNWRAYDEDDRRRTFAPATIRKALDDRDSFTERKREKAYKLLCNLAAHPSYQGFRMITPIPSGDAHCGPFFEMSALKACLEELAKLMIQAGGIFTRFFEAKNEADYLTKIAFMEAQGRWFEKYCGQKFDSSGIEKMRLLMQEVSSCLVPAFDGVESVP
jgi:hypothetical protein